jgi:protein SCO1/2
MRIAVDRRPRWRRAPGVASSLAAPLLLAGALLVAALIAPPRGAAGPAPAFIGATIQNPAVVPDFTLPDQNGHEVRLSAARGKLTLITFLYTECKDVCPLTAGNLNTVLRQFGPNRKYLRVLAVSVDPRGDTPKAVQKFVREHRLLPEFHYLRGSAAQLQPVWQAYNVTSIRRKAGDVDHTLYTLLIDRKGRGRVLYDATALPREIVHDLRLVFTGQL